MKHINLYNKKPLKIKKFNIIMDCNCFDNEF